MWDLDRGQGAFVAGKLYVLPLIVYQFYLVFVFCKGVRKDIIEKILVPKKNMNF